jgi:hypothetical protein
LWGGAILPAPLERAAQEVLRPEPVVAQPPLTDHQESARAVEHGDGSGDVLHQEPEPGLRLFPGPLGAELLGDVVDDLVYHRAAAQVHRSSIHLDQANLTGGEPVGESAVMTAQAGPSRSAWWLSSEGRVLIRLSARPRS